MALGQIDPALAKLPKDHPLAAVDGDLRKLSDAPDAVAMAANEALTRFLPMQLDHLRESMNATKVTRADIPPDIARDWVLPDGRARLQVLPKPDLQGLGGLAGFTKEVTQLAPDAGGPAVTIAATSATIVDAFRTAAVSALLAILVILSLVLRRALDVILVAAPLLLSALLTLYFAVLLGLAAELRQHHRAAVAAGRRRVLQRLFHHELACRTHRILWVPRRRARCCSRR